MTNTSLFNYLTMLAIAAELVFAATAAIVVRRLLRHPPTPASERIGSVKKILTKVREREPLSAEERDYATQIIADRRSLAAYSIPAALFTIGCIYVFGSLGQLHGRAPSLKTWFGVLPMLGSTNLTIQLLKIAALKRRLPHEDALLTNQIH